MSLMADVLGVSKKQIKKWKDDRVKLHHDLLK